MSTANKSLETATTVAGNLDSLPYCTGTFPWDKDKTLFYKGESRFINFPATGDQLQSLFDACSAGKIEPGSFGMSFSPYDEGLVGVLEELLPREHIKTKNIKVELSKLSVYGPGGSSQAHFNAPSSVVGSLIVILPTVHEGGSLILRHGGKEWTLDCSKAVSTPNAQAAFIASYSDIEHEVKSVTSGYQVTLTYNLGLVKDNKTSFTSKQENEQELKEVLDRLLKDPACFPNGGFIGFGLHHHYPIVMDSTKLSDIKEDLKGSDAIIKRACEHLSLDVSVQAFYLDEDEEDFVRGVLMDSLENFEYPIEETLFNFLARISGCKAVAEYEQDGSWEFDFGEQPIVWLRPLGGSNGTRFSYLCEDYKSPWMSAYADICLVARIPPAQGRGLPTAGESDCQ